MWRKVIKWEPGGQEQDWAVRSARRGQLTESFVVNSEIRMGSKEAGGVTSILVTLFAKS